jgi:DNA-binding MarR family transcriptional regulator
MLNEYDHLLNKYRHRFFEERLGALGLAGPRGFYLKKIADCDSVGLNDVVNDSPFHKSHATRAVMGLAQAGLVRKEADPQDQRCIILHITDQGKEITSVIESTMSDWEDLLASALNENERASLNSIMKKVYLHVRQYYHEDENP